MISLDKVKHGVEMYLDREVVNKLPGWRRWVFTAAAAAYLNKAEDLVSTYNDHEAIKILGIIDDQNNIDIEKIYEYIRPAAEKCNAPVELPILGNFTFSVNDVDELYNFIMRY